MSDDDLQKHLKSPKFKVATKEKQVTFGDPIEILLEEVEKVEKSGDESSDSGKNPSELDKEVIVPALKRRK